jgi:hypothetical protein
MSSNLQTPAAATAPFDAEPEEDGLWVENLIATAGTIVAVLLASAIAVVMYLA